MFTSRKLCHNWLKFRTRRQRKKWKWQQLVFLVLEPIRFGMERDRQKKRNVAKIETWKVKGPNIQNYKKCINCGQVFGGKIIITYITIITNNKKREKLIITCITCITYITSIVGIFLGKISHYYLYYLYYHYYQNKKSNIRSILNFGHLWWENSILPLLPILPVLPKFQKSQSCLISSLICIFKLFKL